MSEGLIFTYQARIRTTPEQDAALSGYAELYGKVERSLFAAVQAGKDFSELKPVFMRRFGITARQYNAVAIVLKGKIKSIKKRRPGLIAELQAKIQKVRHTVARLEKKAADPHVLHQKKRRLCNLEQRLKALRRDQAQNTVRICFGGRKLFRSQFALEANGYASLDAWRKEWREARAREFFVIGSKDETAGCQGCVATRQPDGTISLRLRLPDTLGGKHLFLEGLRFAYGQDTIEQALKAGSAISYRFLRDAKSWRVFVSVPYAAPKPATSRLAGAVGIDINTDHLALAEVDRFGNPVGTRKIACHLYGKTTGQRRAAIGDAVREAVCMAKAAGKPVVVEKLDLARPRAELERRLPGFARTLSAFAHAQIQQNLKSACARAGVERIVVHPAYTSVIGAVNYAKRHGISVHQAAALALARRGLGFGERPAVRQAVVPVHTGGHVTFPLPVRNRRKHVWSFWSDVRRKLQAALAAHVRSGPPAPGRPIPSRVLPGWCRCNPGTLTVRKTVRRAL